MMSSNQELRWVVACTLLTMCPSCSSPPYPEPTIDNFDGKLVHEGEQASFAEGETVILNLVFHKNGERFGIPISPEGTFDIGWMPIGKYSASLERKKPGGGRKRIFKIPGGLVIEEGQTVYVIDLGDNYEP